MKKYGVISLGVVPVRKEPADRSEMVNQMLFGDLLEVLEQSGTWYLIKSWYDGYQGWVDSRQFRFLHDEEYQDLQNMSFKINRRLFGDFVMKSKDKTWLPAGCSLYLKSGVRVCGIGEGYLFQGDAHPFLYTTHDALLESARELLGSPYLWGGKTYLGLDCSGFTQIVFKQHGIRLLRDASQQAAQGELISFISESRPGDLAFFDHDDGRISHVGILMNPSQIIHCSGKVRIDVIDHQGIFDAASKQYTHNLRLIRRVTGE